MELNKLRAPFSSEDAENNWAISYGDMITLLLGFFILFFNIKPQVFNLNLIKKDLDQYFVSQVNPTKPSAELSNHGEVASPLYSSDTKSAYKIQANIKGERILVEFPGVSFFNSGNHILTQEGEDALSDFSRAIAKHIGAFRLVVRGYTDEKPIRAKRKYSDNLELSAFRSISAVRFLHNQGIELKNLRIAGYGESPKENQNFDRDLASLQRKIDIIIEPVPASEIKNDSREEIDASAKPFEEVSSATIAKSSNRMHLSDLNEIVESVKEVIDSAKMKAFFNSKAITQNINERLNHIELLQKIVDRSVASELQKKGYSQEQAEKVVNQHNLKHRRTRP